MDFKVPFVQSVHSSRSHAVLRRVAFCGALKDYTTAINALNALCGSHHHHHHQWVVEPGPCFDAHVLSLQADETCWFQRETAVILWSHLDASVLTFNYDAIVDPRLKDGCCK